MKYLKTFEITHTKKQKLYFLEKYDIKKYIVTKFDMDYFLDEVLEFGDERLKIKSIYVFDSEAKFLSRNAGWDTIEYWDLENVEFTSDDYDEAKKYLDDVVELYKNVKKFNL